MVDFGEDLVIVYNYRIPWLIWIQMLVFFLLLLLLCVLDIFSPDFSEDNSSSSRSSAATAAASTSGTVFACVFGHFRTMSFRCFIFFTLTLRCLALSRCCAAAAAGGNILSMLDGPFDPVTVLFDTSLRGNAVDLPDSDPRVRRRVAGFEPEQISLSLSGDHDFVWVSWITGSINHGIR